MTGFFVTQYKWMDNVISVFIYCKHSVSGHQFNAFRQLKMHKSDGKPK